MSTFVFKAMDFAGAKASGEVEAESKQVVADQLKQRGLVVLEIADKRSSREINIALLKKKVKPAELTIMTRQLSTMVSSGMTILRGLYVLEAQTDNKTLQETIVQVRKDVEAGLPLSDAFERHPKLFSPLYVSMTRAGRPAACSTPRCCVSPTSSRRRTPSVARSRAPWPIPRW